jgi:ABC-type multidrug transport system fused ATPase/permease subunit
VVAGEASVGQFIMVNALMLQLFVPLNFMGMVYREIKQGITDIERMMDVLEQKPEVPDRPGAKPLVGPTSKIETVTEGLDGLRERLAEYHKLGARFAKWRAVIAIADKCPSHNSVHANAHALARYAALGLGQDAAADEDFGETGLGVGEGVDPRAFREKSATTLRSC